MMFSNRFIVAVKVNGQILREQSNIVTLPFGSEYTVLLKNLSSRRAMVKVSVDGKDATDRTRLIIGPNNSIDLERSIRNGNLSSGNRFKFIERTSTIEKHRGIGEDDGLIRAEFWAEKEVHETIETIVRRRYIDEDYYRPWYPRPCPYPRRPMFGMRASASAGPSGSSQSLGRVTMDCGDAGITVPGSQSMQQFHSTSGFPLESNSTVIMLNLRGEIAGKSVAAPVTVASKPQCSTCGKTNKAANRFCAQCGTALELI